MLTIVQARFQRDLLTKFLNAKRPNLSPCTFTLYQYCLKSFANYYEISSEGINTFLVDLSCGNARVNYHQIINTFIRWLLKMGYLKRNPLDRVDKPKRIKELLPSVSEEELYILLKVVDNPRDKAMMSLFFDSGMRLSELSNIRQEDIDWSNYTITIWGKGNKQRKAPFTDRSGRLLTDWLYQFSERWQVIRGLRYRSPREYARITHHCKLLVA